MQSTEQPEQIRQNEQGAGKVTSKIVGVDRRGPGHTVFRVDENIFTSTVPRASHWSIAWSDLMMTMFILFLSMFVYKMADEQFLKDGGQEIIGGDTTEALQILDDTAATLPTPPISGSPPLIVSGTIKKIVPVPIGEPPPPPPEPSAEEVEEPTPSPAQPETPLNEVIARIALEYEQKEKQAQQQSSEDPFEQKEPTVMEPQPLPVQQDTVEKPDSFQQIYSLSRDALENNNLNRFASIDIVPDKTVRIILTGDLLFETGNSDLSSAAQKSLRKVAATIKDTPYMINVVGHTDNIPMSSEKFKNNWELSLARSNTVAQFLITEVGMNPNQFVVSGYSSFRPAVPNSSAENRAKNRRVEVIISKRLPAPLPVSQTNLNNLN